MSARAASGARVPPSIETTVPSARADDETSDPTDAAGERLDDAHDERGGDRGVDRITTIAQDLDAASAAR